MNCQKCGNQINPGDVNCGICGTPVAQPVQNVNTEVPAAAPVATLEPVMEEVNNVVAPVAPAPVVPETAPVAPAAPVAPVMPAPVQEVAQPVVAPVEEVVPVAQPTPVAQPAPAAQPVPVAQPAPVAQPVAQPVAAAAPVVQPMPVAPKKNNTVFIIIIVLLVAAICAVGYMLVTDNNPFAGNDTKSSEKENSKDTDKKDDDKDNDKEDEDDDDKKTNDDDDDNKIVNVDTFDYSGYKFKKLDSYQYASQNNVFLVKSSNTAITYYNLVHPYAYSNYTSQPETLKSYFAQSGYYTNIQYGEASYAGRNILVFTSNEAVIFFTKLSDYLTMQTEIVSIGTATNVDQVYAELNEIANSYDSTSMANAAEGEFKFEYTQPEHEEEKNLGTLEFIKK